MQYLGCNYPIIFQKSCPTNPAYGGRHDSKIENVVMKYESTVSNWQQFIEQSNV